MSRFADQLPIVTEPTAANFLLGTDENDPKALVRIPADGLGGAGSINYKIITDDDLENDTKIIEAGSYLFLCTQNADIDISELIDGERIEIINPTTKRALLHGFSSVIVNGTTTVLIETRALNLVAGALIGVKYNDNLYLFNNLGNGIDQKLQVKFAPSDPDWESVVLFLKSIPPHNSKNIADYSDSAKTLTFGNAVASTTQKKYGESSIYLPVNSGLSVSHGSEFNLSSSDFTLEYWFFSETGNDQNYRVIFTLSPLTVARYSYTFYLKNGSTDLVPPFSLGAIPSIWKHFAFVRQGSSLKAYVDGMLVASSTNFTIPNSTQFLFNNQTMFFISHFRLTRSARYAANFNPETDTYLSV